MLDITENRLFNQQLSQQTFQTPAQVVGWMGAVQSQDYVGAKWALGLRLQGVNDDMIEQAFNDGTFLRTHVLRPTWHFVTPADIRWMLELTAPRVNALTAYYYRQLNLDDAMFARSNEILTNALQGGKQLTREELGNVLEAGGIERGDYLRYSHIIMRAELDAVVCSGARRGKQHTYALLDERAPIEQAKRLSRDESLAELTRRYFTSHGPANLKDFVWWSGLTVADAKAGIEMVKSGLVREDINGQTVWFAASNPPQVKPHQVYLLPNFDEYTVAYKDRSELMREWDVQPEKPSEAIINNSAIVLDGQVVGICKRGKKPKTVELKPTFFRSLSAAEMDAFDAAVEQFRQFVGLPVVLQKG